MSAAEPSRDLTLTRLLRADRRAVYRAWTDADILKRWFCPLPWTVPHAELDVRPGGTCRVTMRGPDGTEVPNSGVYLDVVPDERLVFTDAYTEAWVPAEKPFMTAIITLADEAGGTRYTALVRHWSEADRRTHEDMGFHEGWGKCAEQLEAVARELTS